MHERQGSGNGSPAPEVLIEGVGFVACNDLYAGDLSTRIDVFEPDDDGCFQITGWHAFLPVPPRQGPAILGSAA